MPLVEYLEAKRLLSRHGIDSIESRYVVNERDAARFAGKDAIVLKAISDKALHKEKAGLVMVNLKGGDEIGKAYNELRARAKKFAPFKILAQKMAKPGVEIIIGGRTDRQFGKLVLLGLGGIYVEVFRDFSLRVAPLGKNDAYDMIDQLKSRDIITYKGKARDMIAALLMKASKVMLDSDMDELDLNPVIVRENGYDVVDIRMLK